MNDQLHKHLVDREHELERVRTRSLARQQWAAVIEADARISECEKMRAWIVDQAKLIQPKNEAALPK